jgi:hypothetical protein
MIDREIRSDAPRPRAERSAWIEATSRAVNPPEGLDGEFFRRGGIANDANNPSIHLSLKLPEQCLEGFRVSLPEALQQFHGAFLLGLTEGGIELLQNGPFGCCGRVRRGDNLRQKRPGID